MPAVGGYGSPHGKGIDGEERLAQKRDRNEVTNSRPESEKKNSKKVFDISSKPRPNCSSTKMERKIKKKEKDEEKNKLPSKNSLTTSLYITKIHNPGDALESCGNIR
jgi:hypothetical protein